MYHLIQSLAVLLPLFYAASLGLYMAYFYSKSESLGKVASRLFLSGILLHVVYLVTQGIYFKFFPISSSFASMSMLALDIGLIYYIIEKKVKEGRTGFFFLGIIFLFQVISSMFATAKATSNELLSNPWFGVHATVTIMGISALAISALYGLMYLMLAKEIKRHRFGPIYDGLPSLEIIETMGRYATAVGIIILGVGILLGHLWAYNVLGYFFKADTKIIVTDVAWLAYFLGWVIAKVKRLHGLRMSAITLGGFLVFFVTMMLINLLSSTFHKFT